MKRFALLLLLAATVSACSGPQQTTEPRTRALTWSSYEEDFSPESYRAEPVAEAPPTTVRHDVPDPLMQGETGRYEGGARTASGFRIQVLSSQNRETAETIRENLISWWGSVRSDRDAPRTLPSELPIYISYEQPYYKVRIGDFANRRSADESIAFVRREFPDAWIVPDLVNLR